MGASAGGDVVIFREFFLEPDGFGTSRNVGETYSLFMYEALHNLSLGISGIMKECLIVYVRL